MCDTSICVFTTLIFQTKWYSFYLQESLFCVTAATMNIAGGALAIQTYKDMDHRADFVQAGLGMGVSYF